MNFDIAITNLQDKLNKKDLILFIGAGLSIGAELPSWSSLIQPLAESVGIILPHESAITSEHLLSAAQHFENQNGRNSLVRYLREKLDTSSCSPTLAHEKLAKLPIQNIFTTNYDDLLEQILATSGKKHNVIVNELDLAFWSESKIQLVKICGDLKRPESIVLTKGDFNIFFETHRRLIERLRNSLESKTALFLGYSLQDPFFNQLWDTIGLNFGSLRQNSYAVLFDANPLDITDLERRGIHVINLETNKKDRTILLSEFLQRLLA